MNYRMHVQVRIAFVLTLLLLTSCSPQEKAAARLPHVVLFIVDTLRADALSSYGEPELTSVEFDRLAADGVRFARAFSQCSWTRPSIGSMLTGRYPRSTGIHAERKGILPDSFTTLAEVLQGGGYETFGITANPHLNTVFNFDQGFDRYHDSKTVYSFMNKSDKTKYKDGRVNTAAEMFAKAREFIDQPRQAPVYLQFDVMEVHEWSRRHNLTRPSFRGSLEARPNRDYYEALAQVSHDIGLFIDRIKKRPGWDDALFVIVSDHGEGLDDHHGVSKSSSHGRLLYESQVHVPWIMHRAGWEHAGTVVEQPVRLLDMLPTVLEMLDIEAPPELDGRSLMPLIRDPHAVSELPPFFVSETYLRGDNKIALHGKEFHFFIHRDGHAGLDLIELQSTGGEERGSGSNQAADQPQAVETMGHFLNDWEAKHPQARAVTGTRSLSPDELEQLKALGYIQ